MPKGQRQVYGKGELHFITMTCHRQQAKLGVEKHRELFVQLLEEIRATFHFELVGYVVMPDHVHLLITEPEKDTASAAMTMLRQRYGRRYNTSARSDEQVWETKYTDTHVFTPERIAERMRFMHEQPVQAGLVETAVEWAWSSAGRPDGEDA